MAWSTKITSCAHLDVREIERELIKARGNVTAAAKVLGVPSADLRKLVWANTALVDAVFEAVEATLDEAQAIVFEALRSDDKAHRLAGAKAILRTPAGKRRGWGTGSAIDLGGVDEEEPTTTIKWLEN
jgi:hypothetical protein